MTNTSTWKSAGASSFALLNGSLEIAAWLIMLPTISRQFDASKTEIAWVVVAFALGLAGSGLAAGRLSDLIGLKRMAVATFAGEIVLLAGIVVAPELWMLYPLRFLQGVARAGSTNATAALLIGSFSAERRGRVLGGRYALAYAGQLLGALTAAFLTEAWGWRAAIAGITSLTIGHTLLVVLFARSDPPRRDTLQAILRRFDWPGAAAFLLATSIFIFATQLFKGGTVHWGVICLAIAASILWLAVRIERRAATPALELQLFKNGAFTAATASLMIMALATGTANFLFPFYMQDGLGWSPSVSATAYVAMNFMQMLASPVMGSLADRLGARRLVITGAAIAIAAFLVASAMGRDVEPWQVAGVMLAIGLGMSIFETPNNSVIFRNAGPALGSASAITGVYRYVGLSLGGAMGAILLTVAGQDDLVSGFAAGMLLLAITVAIGLSAMQLLQLRAERKAAAATAAPAGA